MIGVAVAEKNVAAPFFVIVAGRFAVARKEGLVRRFGLCVHLAITHQSILRAVGGSAAHVIGIADFAFGEGFAAGQLGIFAGGADEGRCVGGVVRDEAIERFFGKFCAGFSGEFRRMLVGVNLHGDENLLEILLASAKASLLPAGGIATPIHGGQDEDDKDGDEQFNERKGIDWASVGWTRPELWRTVREFCWNA